MPGIDDSSLGLIWVAPFGGILLSLALLPWLMPHLWRQHFGKISVFWAAVFVVPFVAVYGVGSALPPLAHILALDYLPFIILLGALYLVAGGIRLTGTIHGTAAVNTLLLLIGAVIANVMGTTGAAILLVRPLIRANRRRRHNAHVFIFFVFLVANIGGALSPLGNPPLLLGYLNGVPFFWTTTHLLLPTAVIAGPLLIIFYLVDRHFHRRAAADADGPIAEIERLGIDGKINLPFLALIPLVVLAAGALRPLAPVFVVAGLPIDAATMGGNLTLIAIALISLWLTDPATHRANEFAWHPIIEVALIFAAIFVTILPAVVIMRAGAHGAIAPLVGMIAQHPKSADAMYFWLTGALSSVLDSAPAYLAFFNFAGGDPAALTGPLARTLVAISTGAVFMGAATYIGNAPNLMIKAICEDGGIAMPSFLGYMLWAAVVLVPLYGLVTVVFFR